MKSFLKIILYVIGVVVLLIIAFVLYISIKGVPSYPVEKVEFDVEITEASVAEGERLASMLCNHCHRSYTDNQLTGRLVEDIDPAFGKIYSANITQHPEYGIGSWTDGEIAYMLRTGIKRDGQYAPPYMPKFPNMSDSDVEAIIAYLRSDKKMVQPNPTVPPKSQPSFLTKFLTNFVIKPLPYPEHPVSHPSLENKVKYGKYLATASLGCYECHSADFKTNNPMEPSKSPGFFGGGNKLFDMEGNEVYSPNITMDKTGIGSWTEEQFIEAVRFGKRPDGTMLAFPMFPFSALSEEEVGAIWAYLKTVPKITNEVPRKGQKTADL